VRLARLIYSIGYGFIPHRYRGRRTVETARSPTSDQPAYCPAGISSGSAAAKKSAGAPSIRCPGGNARELERCALGQREEPRTLAGEARKQIGSANVARRRDPRRATANAWRSDNGAGRAWRPALGRLRHAPVLWPDPYPRGDGQTRPTIASVSPLSARAYWQYRTWLPFAAKFQP